MAKRPTKGNGTSKVRFIMLEAEMPEGDLTQITAAIQNALRPASISGPRQSGKPTQFIATDQDAEETGDVVENSGEYEEFDAEPAEKPTAKPRRPAKRKVVEMDLASDVSLRSFSEQYPPQTDQDRFLVALLYLKENRADIDAITGDHLYTCFRHMEWRSGAKDFTQPLRTLKKDQFVDAGDSRGTYVINHVGEDRVKKLAEA